MRLAQYVRDVKYTTGLPVDVASFQAAGLRRHVGWQLADYPVSASWPPPRPERSAFQEHGTLRGPARG